MVDSKTPKEVEKDIQLLRDWIDKQPHLPKDLDDKVLKRFLHSCYYSLEKTKKCIELFFNIRSTSPELFTNRDPLSESMQKTLKILNMAVLKISGNRNLWLWQLNDPGLEKYDYLMDAKVFLLGADAWMLGNQHLEDSDIALMDVKDITLKFITKFNVSVARKLSKFQEEAMPIRLKQVHIVNAPPFIDKLYALMKPFMKQEYIDMVHFHSPNSETLYKYINKEELPNDYGGTAGKMDDLMKETMKLILDRRDILKNDTFWKIDENKRPKDSKSTDILATGSFRSLAID